VGALPLRVGVVFPQNEITPSGAAAVGFARTVESLGFRHVLAYDHVVGADPAAHPGWSGPYDVDDEFHEPLVLAAHLAAVTDLELVTGVLVLPQRQAVLVAKQAATVAHLSGGRLRLGVGTGWNAVEYAALGKPFADRGERLEEQVRLMRRLWTERAVDGAGIAPLPETPVPVWFGTYARARRPLQRIGRLGDGWLPVGIAPGPELGRATATVRAAAEAAGRDPDRIGLEGRVRLRETDVIAACAEVRGWAGAGATHVTVDTRGQGLRDEAHTDLLHELAEALGLDTEKETVR
jgi:probable F420-dependent oxidoreductase